jgi:hypothetical protein
MRPAPRAVLLDILIDHRAAYSACRSHWYLLCHLKECPQMWPSFSPQDWTNLPPAPLFLQVLLGLMQI